MIISNAVLQLQALPLGNDFEGGDVNWTSGNAGAALACTFDFSREILVMQRRCAVRITELEAWLAHVPCTHRGLRSAIGGAIIRLRECGDFETNAHPLPATLEPGVVLWAKVPTRQTARPQVAPTPQAAPAGVQVLEHFTPAVKRQHAAVSAYMAAHGCSYLEAFTAVRNV